MNFVTGLLTFFGTLAMLNGVITFPLIFNYSIIPGIEKKIGKKLKFIAWIYITMPFESLAYNLEISPYIIFKFLRAKLGIDPDALDLAMADLANQKALLHAGGYPYNMFETREIVWSFLALFNAPMFFISGMLLVYIQENNVILPSIFIAMVVGFIILFIRQYIIRYKTNWIEKVLYYSGIAIIFSSFAILIIFGPGKVAGL